LRTQTRCPSGAIKTGPLIFAAVFASLKTIYGRPERLGPKKARESAWADEEAVCIRKCKGDFDKRKPGWNCKARLEEHLMTFCLNKFGKEPVHSMLCVKISDWFPDLKADRRKVEN
jgi:hypothetical protein